MIVSMFGCPNASKTSLRRALAERNPEMGSHGIDGFRKEYGGGTTKGESAAEMKFLETMDKEGGFYESSGMGSCAKDALDFFVEDHYVIVVDTLEDVCVSRIREGKYDGIPFPFSGTGEEYIRHTHEFLKSRTFRRWCVDILVLWVDGMLPLEEQSMAVEEFAGL